MEELLEVEVDEVVVGAAEEREAEAIGAANVLDAGVGAVAGLGQELRVAAQRGRAGQREEAGQLEGAAPGAAHLPAGVGDRPARADARTPLDLERLRIVGAQAALDHQRTGVEGGGGEGAGRGAREPVVANDVAAEERREKQRALALAALVIELRAERDADSLVEIVIRDPRELRARVVAILDRRRHREPDRRRRDVLS